MAAAWRLEKTREEEARSDTMRGIARRRHIGTDAPRTAVCNTGSDAAVPFLVEAQTNTSKLNALMHELRLAESRRCCIAARYRRLVEWCRGTGFKCAFDDDPEQSEDDGKDSEDEVAPPAESAAESEAAAIGGQIASLRRETAARMAAAAWRSSRAAPRVAPLRLQMDRARADTLLAWYRHTQSARCEKVEAAICVQALYRGNCARAIAERRHTLTTPPQIMRFA